MFSRNNCFRLHAVVVIGLFACSQTSPANEPGIADEVSRAAEIAQTVTANGERRADDDSLTIAQVTAQTPEGPTFPDETEVDRVVVTGTNIASDSPPFVPETIFNREAVERTGSRSLGDFFQSLPQNSGPSFT